MTVSSTTNIVVYEGNGATTIFSYAFLIPAQSDAVITYTDAAGAETILNTTQYSITGLDNASGGMVTYPLSGSPIADETFLTIQRTLPLVQSTDLVNQDGFYPQVVEDALDYLCMLIQQISTLNSQAIRVPSSEASPNELPAAALRANQSLIFDSNGQPTVGSTTTATVSAAMQPVVAAATLAAGRTALGVGFVPSAVTTNQTVALANISTRYMATGALTFTMPDSTQVSAGFSFDVYALTADCVLDPVGTDTIYGYSIGANATVAAGTIVNIVTDGAGNWWPATIIASEDFVGAIRPAAVFNAPSAKYVFCDGVSYLRATYPACFAAISMAVTVTKTNGNPVLGGFTSAQTAKLAAGMLVEGTGIPSGALILTTPAAGDTSITLDQNATNSTTQLATIIPFGAADTTHFNVPDTRGRVMAGAELATNVASRLTSIVDRIGRGGGAQTVTISQANLPSVNFAVTDNRTWLTDDNFLPSGGASAPGAGALTAAATKRGNVSPSGAAPTAASGGSGTAVDKVQPTLVVNHLMRVLP